MPSTMGADQQKLGRSILLSNRWEKTSYHPHQTKAKGVTATANGVPPQKTGADWHFCGRSSTMTFENLVVLWKGAALVRSGHSSAL